VLYRIVAAHLETWLAMSGSRQGDQYTPSAYAEQALRKCLERGILASGLARV